MTHPPPPNDPAYRVWDEDDNDGVIAQPRCPYCKVEHYCLNVPAISHGQVGCDNCGRIAPVFTTRIDYVALLRQPKHQLPEEPA
jgi:hypothetical protein